MFVEWQGTGPSEDNRITEFTCKLDDQTSEICEYDIRKPTPSPVRACAQKG